MTRLAREKDPRRVRDRFKSLPLVSIGMPVYNCEKTLGVAIRSILQQTFQDWELLILDDGSSDKTVGVGNSGVVGGSTQ
jgi:GT2 family glycosyltransferase